MKQLRARVARYFGFLGWFLADAAFRYRRRLVGLAALSAGGLACQAAAFFMSYRYALALERDTSVHFLGESFAPRLSFELLVAVAALAFVLILLAAFLITTARVAAIVLAQDYAEFCSQRVYVLASRMPSVLGAERDSEPETRHRLFEFAVRDANYCGTTLRILARGMLPIGTVVVAGTALLAMEPALSALLLSVVGVAGVFLYRVSIEGAVKWAAVRAGTRNLHAERGALAERVERSSAALRPDDSAMAAMYRNGFAAKMNRAMIGQRQVIERGYFIAQIAIGCAVLFILLVQGGATLRNESHWSGLVAYLGVFTILATNFASLTRVLVAVNRFYPRLGEYARFVQRAAGAAAQPRAFDGYLLPVASLVGGAARLATCPGERIALVLPHELDRYALKPLSLALRGIAGEAVVEGPVLPWFATGRFTPLAGTLRENFGLPEGYDDVHLEADLAVVGLRSARAKSSKTLEARLVFAVAVLSGIRGGQGVLVLDSKSLAVFDAADAQRLLELASRCVIAIAYPASAVDLAGTWGERAIVLSDSERIVGWAPIQALKASDERVLRAISDVAATGVRAKPGPLVEAETIDEVA